MGQLPLETAKSSLAAGAAAAAGWGGLGDSPLPSPELTPTLTPSPNLNAQNNPRGPDGGMAGALLGALLLLELLGKDRGGTHARDNDTGHRTKTRGREGG